MDTFNAKEGTTPVFTCTVQDENEDPIGSASLDTLTLTLVNTKTGTVIRDEENVLNTGGVTVSALGALTWNVLETDLIVPDGELSAVLRATFKWTWGAKRGWHSFDLKVEAEQPAS